jgi:hypothetical protein
LPPRERCLLLLNRRRTRCSPRWGWASRATQRPLPSATTVLSVVVRTRTRANTSAATTRIPTRVGHRVASRSKPRRGQGRAMSLSHPRTLRARRRAVRMGMGRVKAIGRVATNPTRQVAPDHRTRLRLRSHQHHPLRRHLRPRHPPPRLRPIRQALRRPLLRLHSVIFNGSIAKPPPRVDASGVTWWHPRWPIPNVA